MLSTHSVRYYLGTERKKEAGWRSADGKAGRRLKSSILALH
jgi:hypothetical protein